MKYPVLMRVMAMMAIMAVQTLVAALMVLNPGVVYVYYVLWWVLSGVFWWNFFKAMKGQ